MDAHTDTRNPPPLIPFTKSPQLQCVAVRFGYNVDLWVRKSDFLSAFLFIFLHLHGYRKPEICFTMFYHGLMEFVILCKMRTLYNYKIS